MSRAIRLLAHLSFWLATLVMVVVGWLLYDVTTAQMASSRRVGHTYEVLEAIADVDATTSRAESAQRGYLLSGSEAFLSERDRAFDKLKDNLARIKKMTSDNLAQQDRLPQLEESVATRLAIMRESVRLFQGGATELVRDRATSGIGRQASARIYELTAALRQEEQRLLEVRLADTEQGRDMALRVLAASVLFGVMFLIPAYLGFVLQARARQQTETKLRVMADALPGAMYQMRFDPRGKPHFTFMSAGVTNDRGIAAATLPDFDSMVGAIDERDRPAYLAALTAARQSQAAFRHEYRVTHADGTSRWLRNEATLQKERGGSVLMNGYAANITEQKRLEHSLHEAKEAADFANRAKSVFLTTMSHEIRTPMNGVLGMLELLSLTKLDAEQRGTLEIVRASSKSLLRILDDILDFSKIEAGKLEIRPEVASIKEAIEDVHNIYSGNASRKGLTIDRVVDPNIGPALLVDPVRLRQILNNFVSNALKFTSQGSIQVRAELLARGMGEEQLRFSVQDSGSGISAEEQRLLFRPFSQGDGSAARRAGGTGLGLTICRRLAGLMGGSVDMVSEPGKGTTMTLTLSLPIADRRDLPKTDPESARDLLTTTKMRRMAPSVAQAEAEGTLVLLVDDHPTNRALLLHQLHALGYAAESAEDGVQALASWKSGRFGIVITDCNMPNMDGYELARSIRGMESANGGQRTPIIACTANALAGQAEICFAAGMDDCMVKPVELAKILEKLNRWLPIPPVSEMSSTTGHRPDGASAAAPVDRSVLAEISGGDSATERDILAEFRRANDEDALMLERAVASGDIAQITDATHRIQGASRSIGALALAGRCERLEQASRANDAKAVAAGMQAFRQEWTRLNVYFDSV